MTQASIISPKRYHPALVALHWTIALLIFANVLLAGADDVSLAGIPAISIHMTFGILILVLLIIRLVLRFATQHPAWASTGNALLNKIGELTHWGLYLLTFGMTITGILLASQSNRLARLFGLPDSPAPRFTPGQFRGGGFRLGGLHGMIWILLGLLVLLHIGAALYHQFFLKDNLLKRMWFGKRYE